MGSASRDLRFGKQRGKAYFELLELDSEMDIATSALDSRKESLRLVEIREKGGTTSMMDVRQSEQLVYAASAAIPDLQRRIEQQENLISILLGRNPGPVTRRLPLLANVVPQTFPLGCLLPCWKGVRILSPRNKPSWRQTPGSAWRKLHTFPKSLSPVWRVIRVPP